MAENQSSLLDYTLGELLDRAIEMNPDGEAIIYVDRNFRLTYREFGRVVDDLARGLMSLGVQHGEKVAIWANNVPYWVAFQFATAKIGAVLVTVNTHYKTAELDYLLRQSEAEHLVIIDHFRDSDYVAMTYELIPELKTQQRGYLRSERFPNLKKVYFLDQEKHRGMYSLPEILSMSRMVGDDEYEARKKMCERDQVVNMQYTSGTTGFPKGVQLTHRSIGNNGYQIGENMNLSEIDRICLPVPLFHCFGCVLGVLAAVSHASCLVILEDFDPIQVMASVEQEKCTALYGVPTMFIAVLEHKLFDKFDYSSLRTGIMAGSPCPVKTMEDVITKMNMTEVTICYGLTEASPVMTQTLPSDDIRKRCETVGRPMPHVEVKLVHPETGEPIPQGEVGEVLCRGYNIMKGYYNMPEATEKAVDKDGWLWSGDLGVFDEDGYLSITGRSKDMVIRGGENIYPREIEEYLLRMDGVQDVQVVGVPSRKYGEELGAFIQLKKNADVSPEDIKDYCRGRISRYKVPKYVTFVNEYPLTASGKIQKYLLRDEAAKLWPDA